MRADLVSGILPVRPDGREGDLRRRLAELGDPGCREDDELLAGLLRSFRDRAPTTLQALRAAMQVGDAALVEQLVVGTEVAVTVLDTGEGPYALPAVEIRPLSGVYDYTARYTAGQTEFYAPARLADEAAARVAQAAVLAHTALGLRDLSRSDLMIDAESRVWFLEVNVAPGLTETSTVPLAVRAAGLDLGTLVSDLVQAAVDRAG